MSESKLELPSWVPDWNLKSIPFDANSPLATSFDGNRYFEAGGTEHSIHLGENLDELIVKVFAVGNVHLLEEVFEYQEDPPPTPHHRDVQQASPTLKVAPQIHESPVDGASETNRTSEANIQISPPVESGEMAVPDDEEWSKYPVLFHILGVVHAYLHMSLSPLYKDKDEIEIIWRTMICDRELGTQRKAPPEYETYFQSYIDHVKLMYGIVSLLDHVSRIQDRILNSPLRVQIHTPEQLFDLFRRLAMVEQEKASKFKSAARKFCHSMRISITGTGAVGLVPRCTQKGDVVVVVKGVNVPLVLRRERDDHFKVVGQAYFWGFMNGEAFEMDNMEQEEIVLT